MKKTLHVLSGPCGAGKTTRSAELAMEHDGAVVVSWDVLWSRLRVISIPDAMFQKMIVKEAANLLNGPKQIYVIVDAHNLHESDRITWETIAHVFEAEFIFERLETPVDVCIARDSVRPNPVGEKWIRKQATEFWQSGCEKELACAQ